MNKKQIIPMLLFMIVVLGTFLRFYRLIPNLILNGEMGTDYMNVWNILHGTRTFLIGPRTSHEWFFIPPISYWIYSLLLFLSKYNPVIINIFWAIVGSLTVPVSYFYIKKIFNEKVALISSFLIAVSPAWIIMTRASRYNAPAAILFIPYFYYLIRSIRDGGKSLWVLGIILGVSMSFFPSPFLLIPAAVVALLFYRVKPKFKYILYSIAGFILPNLTYLIYEAGNKFQITIQILEWIPFRILGFFGLYPKNTATGSVISQNIYSIYQFFADTFSPNFPVISIILFTIILAVVLIFFKKSLKNKNENMPFILLIIILAVSYLGLFIHGDPPEHYYLVIFPIPIFLTAYFLDKIFKKAYLLFITLFIGVICIMNLLKSDWFNQDKYLANYTETSPPYPLQVEVADEIIKDASGKEISVLRIGRYDKFENDFANNYIYLLTIGGAKIKNGVFPRYTIVEDRYLPEVPEGKLIWEENGVQIYKL